MPQPKKEFLKDQIAKILGLSAQENPPMSTGSTEPKEIFDLVDHKLQLNLDPEGGLTKHQIAAAIVRYAGGDWNPDCESRGGTVTKIGLNKVLDATILLQRQHRRQRQQQIGYLTVGDPEFPENDYEALRNQNNTGIAAEFGIAASLMAPEQRRVFEVETIDHHSQIKRIQGIYGELDPTPINDYCFPRIGKTDTERYIYLAPQDDSVGPSDLVVYDLRRSVRVGISIKEENLNIKNPSPERLHLPAGFKAAAEARIPDFIPDWIAEWERRKGDLVIDRAPNGNLRRNWGGARQKIHGPAILYARGW